MKKNAVKQKNSTRRKKVKIPAKLIITVCAFLFSSLMVLGSTYAWFVSEDEETNHFVGARLAAEIVEEFEPNFEWQSGATVKKVVQVKNTGNVPAFVRISLYEYLLMFKIDVSDQTGNGNLAVAPNAVQPVVDRENPAGWSSAAQSGGTYFYDGRYYIAKNTVVPSSQADMYKFKDSQRDQTDLGWFQLNFPLSVYDYLPAKGTKNFWLYQEGYFYYSELLQPNELTDPVISSVSLNQSAPNKVKGALYKLEPVMDAHDATQMLLSNWAIDPSSSAYNLYRDKLSD
ncbi:BsaA family SipW-dependent biofilm matrix protein [Enterococcus termitis]|uniref:Alternate signal-mediated exported protein n=1 Tax=Enterococcus termitis TaxID=332950 RepID=A0A1E5G8Y3_9ENTE|nr:BsaA family SipW-dependent biofilm matrix protein [Enterococcus termitis]OEG09166.1 hypothetical protein BCR25_11385 [Enterococcus termitis]OJG98623.1 alternate signal-mediated exported protein [Enterococcus termitis]